MKISINPSSIKTKVMMVNAIIIIAISIALSSMSYFEAEKMTIETLTSEFTATTKDKKAHPDRMETKKYCRFCKTHTLHKETK